MPTSSPLSAPSAASCPRRRNPFDRHGAEHAANVVGVKAAARAKIDLGLEPGTNTMLPLGWNSGCPQFDRGSQVFSLWSAAV